MRAIKRKDANHREIISQLRQIGCSVFDTSNLGEGFPDIVVGFRGKNYLFEIKDGSKPPSQRKLREKQIKFLNDWRGEVYVIENLEDALKVLGVIQI